MNTEPRLSCEHCADQRDRYCTHMTIQRTAWQFHIEGFAVSYYNHEYLSKYIDI